MTDSLALPRIVCAAVRTLSYGLLIGPRHMDATMRRHAALHNTHADDLDSWGPEETRDQGFIDQFGTYYSRTEAWKIAEARGQILRRVGGDTRDGGTLFSENLY